MFTVPLVSEYIIVLLQDRECYDSHFTDEEIRHQKNIAWDEDMQRKWFPIFTGP